MLHRVSFDPGIHSSTTPLLSVCARLFFSFLSSLLLHTLFLSLCFSLCLSFSLLPPFHLFFSFVHLSVSLSLSLYMSLSHLVLHPTLSHLPFTFVFQDAGAPVGVRDKRRQGLAHYAARAGNIAALEHLAPYPILDGTDRWFRTPLKWAVRCSG